MTTISARDIAFNYYKIPHTASMPMYVPLQEYEALQQKRLELGETISRIMDDNHELLAGLAKRDNDYKELRQAYINGEGGWQKLALRNLPTIQAAFVQHKEDTQRIEALRAILQQWLEISKDLPVGWVWPELSQVVIATKAVLGE